MGWDDTEKETVGAEQTSTPDPRGSEPAVAEPVADAAAPGPESAPGGTGRGPAPSFGRRRVPDLDPKTYRKALILVFVAALSLRIGIAHVFHGLGSPPDIESNPDQVDYEKFAYQMSLGHGYAWSEGEPTAQRPPGTSLALLPVYWVFGRNFVAGRLWFCLLSTLTVISTAWLTKLCFGRAVALIAALWLAFYPGHFYYSIHFLSELPYNLWMSIAAGSAIYALRLRRRRFGFVSGLFLGLAVLTRPQIAPILVMAPLAATFGRDRGHSLRVAVSIVGGALLILTPWVVRNAAVIGQPTLSTIGGFTFWGGNNEVVGSTDELRGLWIPVDQLLEDTGELPVEEVAREGATWRHGFDYLLSRPDQLPELFLWKLIRFLSPFEETPNRAVFWSFAVAWLVSGPLVLLGFVRGMRVNRRAMLVLAMPLAATLVSVMIFYGSIRFRDSLASLFVVPVSYAVWTLLWRQSAPVLSRPGTPGTPGMSGGEASPSSTAG